MISIIAAVADNGVIGRDNTLPWHLPQDLRYFKSVTMGHPVIMGRKNYEDIGKPLPGRLNIIISRDKYFVAEGCVIAHSIEEAISAAGANIEAFVIGGAQIYRLFLPFAKKMYITEVHTEAKGDIKFPDFDKTLWQPVSREDYKADSSNPYDYSFVLYERVPGSPLK